MTEDRKQELLGTLQSLDRLFVHPLQSVEPIIIPDQPEVTAELHRRWEPLPASTTTDATT